MQAVIVGLELSLNWQGFLDQRHKTRRRRPNIDNGDDDERQRCDAFVANAYPLLTTFDFVAESSGEVGLSIDRGRFIDIPRDPMASCEVLNKLNVLFLGYCPVVN